MTNRNQSWEEAQIRLSREWERNEIAASTRWEARQIRISVLWELRQLLPAARQIVAVDNGNLCENVVMANSKKSTKQGQKPVAEAASDTQNQIEPEQVEVQSPPAAERRTVLVSDARKAARPQRTGRRPCCP